MGRHSKSKNRSGFTLVELLIVVGIAGVLSIIGIPQFRRMLMKARKAEARQALGALYAANSAFFSEYNVYGNNLLAIGFEMDAAAQGRRYTIGFPVANCTDTAIMPDPANVPYGTNLNNVYGGYFTAQGGGALPAGFSVANSGGQVACEPAASQADGQGYIATATGYIRPFGNAATQSPDIPTAVIGEMDVFTLDQLRNLNNTRDGVE